MRARSIPLRLWLVSTVASACALSAGMLAGCTSDNPPVVYLGMAYQVRCLDCQPRVPDSTARDIRAVHGEGGHELSCNVTEKDGARRVTFGASHENSEKGKNYWVQVEDAPLSDDGDEADELCEVRVVEGDNTFTAGCSRDEPSDERPCQVRLEVKDEVVTGGLYCKHIQNESNTTISRYVVAPNTESEPAKIELYGCRGL